jgi:hypothetical protein
MQGALLREGVFQYKNEEYPFCVLKKEVSDLQFFSGFFQNKILFISEEVPEEYFDFIFIHEIEESKAENRTGRCYTALSIELENVPTNVFYEYITFRSKMFQLLVDYYEKLNHSGEYTEFLGELKRSNKNLLQLIKMNVSIVY